MTGFFKKASLLCLAASLIGCSAYAEINTSQDGSNVKIYGSTVSEKIEKNVIANILAPGKDYEDLLAAGSEGYENILVYHNQKKTTAEGEFEFIADMTGMPSGLYRAYVTDSGEGADLIYTDMEKNEDAIEWLADLTDKPTEEEFAAKQADLGFYNSLYDSVDTEEVIDILYDAVKNGKFDYSAGMSPEEKRNKALAVFNKAVGISALNAGAVENIFDISDDIDLKNSEVADFLDLSFNSKTNFASELTKRMSGCGFDTEEEFEEALTEQYVLSAVRYPDGYNNLPELLNHFDDELGLTKKVTATVASKISGNEYETAENLAKAVNSMSASSTGSGQISSGSSGGSGGGSYGGGGSSNKTPDLEIGTETGSGDDVIEYHVDIFTDIEGVEWAKEAIVYLAELDIIHGDGNFKFYPENNVTREEFTKMVVQAFAPDATEAEILFNDVSDSDWFAPYIKKAKGLGIISGQSETFFGAGQNITRQDMAVIGCNAAKMYGISFNDESKTLFEDDSEISDYAKNAVYSLRAGGILNGKDNNAFCPTENATRAEAAKIIYGLLEM